MDEQDQQAMVVDLCEQAEDLCHLHDHVTRVIANLEIPSGFCTDYRNPADADFDANSMVKTFLYQEIQGLSQNATADRLRGAAYIWLRFGFSKSPTQQTLSYTWRNRFGMKDRRLISDAADRIRTICDEHDVIGHTAPALDPDNIHEQDLEEELIMDAVKRATGLGFAEFVDPRAENAKYDLEAYFERQGYLNMSDAGVTTERRRFARLSDRKCVPHGSTHNRTIKKIATPDEQATFSDFHDGGRQPEWKRIRNQLLPAFHRGVEKQLAEIGIGSHGIREPVTAAVDITTINFWPSPTLSDDEITDDDEPVQTKEGDCYPKEEFPAMVSGFKKKKKNVTERGYKFATLTIVGKDTPIVLAIEPVREHSWWEGTEADIETTSRADIVEGLVQQAQQHVDINKLFADKEFDNHAIRDFLDREQIQYVTGKTTRSKEDRRHIEEVTEDPVYDTRIEHVYDHYGGRRHKASIVYLPGEKYSQFVLNGWVDPDRVQALTEQYRDRWEIENQYKTIKQNFLPKTSSKDYRSRFSFFIIGVIMYNVWRLSNFLLRDAVDVDLGDSPPLRAGEIVEMVGLCLFGHRT